MEERRKRSENYYNPNLGPRNSAVSNSASDFKKRKEEYLKNKAKAQGVNNPLAGRANANRTPVIKANEKRDEKSDYEERLRRIRMQNFNNRKNQYKKEARSEAAKKIEQERAARLERIEALRRQAKGQQVKLDNELAKKRQREVVDKEIQEVRKLPDFKPEPAIRMTEVFNAIGVQDKKMWVL